MSNIDKQELRNAATAAISAITRLNYEADSGPADAEAVRAYHALAHPEAVLTLLDDLEAAEKRIAELPGQKRLIGWRMADYTDETADPALAKNWATAVDVLPIFEGDVNTKLSAAAAGKGE